MNSRPVPNPNADEQAALWAARLEGSRLNPHDQAALDMWLAESPAHRALLSSYCQFSADLEVKLPVLVAAGKITLPVTAKPVRSRWSYAPIIGAMAAAALVLGLWIVKPGARWESFASPPGQRQTVALGDGTRVELNGHTALQFANRGDERRAKLLSGEALFQVSKDKAHPFIVDTPAGSVRVTGTTFDVRADEASLDVTVVEGSVQVLVGVGQVKPVALEARDQLSTTGTGGMTLRKLSSDALDDVLAWREGIVVFDGERLDSALARFAHYQDRTIHVTPAAAARPVSGRYSLDDLDGFLSGIAESLGVRTTQEAGRILKVSLRSE